MAKLTILLALLATLLVAASAYKNHHEEATCDSVMEEVDLSPCENFIMQRIQQDEEGEDEEEEDEVPSMKVIKRHSRRNYIIHKGKQDYEEKCCDELSEFKKLFGGRTRCMCKAQKEIMKSLQKQDVESQTDLKKLKKEIYRLPNACDVPLYERIGCSLDDYDDDTN